MVFEGSDTSLTEDILRKPPEFVMSWTEWAADNLLFAQGRAVQTNVGTITLFTVPDKQTLFVTSAAVSCESSVATPGQEGGINLLNRSGGVVSLLMAIQLPASGNAAIANSFPMPIKVEEGGIVELSSSITPGHTRATFQGFLVNKKIS